MDPHEVSGQAILEPADFFAAHDLSACGSDDGHIISKAFDIINFLKCNPCLFSVGFYDKIATVSFAQIRLDFFQMFLVYKVSFEQYDEGSGSGR